MGTCILFHVVELGMSQLVWIKKSFVMYRDGILPKNSYTVETRWCPSRAGRALTMSISPAVESRINALVKEAEEGGLVRCMSNLMPILKQLSFSQMYKIYNVSCLLLISNLKMSTCHISLKKHAYGWSFGIAARIEAGELSVELADRSHICPHSQMQQRRTGTVVCGGPLTLQWFLGWHFILIFHRLLSPKGV